VNPRPRREILGSLLAVWLGLPALAGCVTRPYLVERCTRNDLSGCLVEKVSVKDAHKISADATTEKIATVETGRAFGGALEHVPIFSIWDRLTVSYHRFDPFVLERDLARVERYYRARGYYEAHARAGRVQKVNEGEVRVEIAVDEGEPVTISTVSVAWKDAGPEKVRVLIPVEEARQSLAKGAIFEEAPFEETKKLLLRAMTDHGFAYAKVTGRSTIDLGTHKAQVVYELELGPYCQFGDIRIEGQGELPTAPLLGALGIRARQEFSTAALESAEIALTDFGTFGSVDVLPELSAAPPYSNHVPVLFRVHPTPLRAVKLGGGVEIGSRVEVHGLAGWENKNLFGGLRRFTVEGKPGFVFYPKSFDTLASSEKVHVLFEFKSHFELQQPAFLEARTVGIFGGSYNHYRQTTTIAAADNPRLPTAITASDGQQIPYLLRQNTDRFVVGYNEVAGVAGVQRPFWRSRINLALFGRVQYENPFPYIADGVPDGYKPLIIPYAQATASLDLRYDQDGKRTKLAPHSGFYASADLQGAWGPDTQDVRILPEVRGYIPLPRGITIALRVSLGFLFPFKEYFVTGCGSGASADTDGACGRALQIAQFRAFFSGGQSSNRGYSYNGVGPHEQVSSKSLDLLPTGGNRLWEASAELRFPITGKFGSAAFVDASDVSRDAFRLGAPHLSAGLGLRYETPVGPFRADIGYRIPCMQVVGRCEPVYDALATSKPGFRPGDYLSPGAGEAGSVFGLPIAVNVAIGEAF
jgi:outer membrane protein insertion porin family/translocation and assembly module TamA